MTSAARKVVITDHTYPMIDLEEQTLAPLGAQIAEGQCRTPEAVLALGGDADALIVQFSPITWEVIAGLTRCKIIARCGIGVDNIDIAAATERGIWVTNVPDYCIDEVADHTLGMLLAANRRICALDRAAREFRWECAGRRRTCTSPARSGARPHRAGANRARSGKARRSVRHAHNSVRPFPERRQSK